VVVVIVIPIVVIIVAVVVLISCLLRRNKSTQQGIFTPLLKSFEKYVFFYLHISESSSPAVKNEDDNFETYSNNSTDEVSRTEPVTHVRSGGKDTNKNIEMDDTAMVCYLSLF
jgi:uncharacterized membrane protein